MGIKMSDEPSGDLTLNLGIIEFTSEKGCASIDIRYPANQNKGGYLAFPSEIC